MWTASSKGRYLGRQIRRVNHSPFVRSKMWPPFPEVFSDIDEEANKSYAAEYY